MTSSSADAALDAQSAERQRHPLARGIELLTYMVDSEQETHGVRELAGKLGVSPSTAHRLIGDLERLDLVTRAPNGSFGLGMEFLRLAWTTTHRFPWHEAATSVLDDMTQTTGETSFFAIYSEQRRKMMFSVTVESTHPLRYVVPTGSWLPLHAGASGLAILAFLPADVQSAVASSHLDLQTDRTIVEPEALLSRLGSVHTNGYAITHGERIQGAIAIAAPVFGLSGIVGSAGISIPETRFNAAQSSELIDLVKQGAARMSAQLTGLRVTAPGAATP